jgi:site-specific recombinase XerD
MHYLSALLFLYRYALQQPLPESIDAVRARQSQYLPTVLTTEELQRLLQHLEDNHQLLAKLLYGAGLRVKERLRLPVKDLDFAQNQICPGSEGQPRPNHHAPQKPCGTTPSPFGAGQTNPPT